MVKELGEKNVVIDVYCYLLRIKMCVKKNLMFII